MATAAGETVASAAGIPAQAERAHGEESRRPAVSREERVALIVAAGRADDGLPAAARRVAGLTLLERSLFIARDAGAQRAIVVGDEASREALRASVVRSDIGIPVEYENLESCVLDRRLATAGDVVVLRADVVQSYHVAKRLKEAPAAQATVLVGTVPTADADSGLALRDGRPWIGAARVPATLALAIVEALRRGPGRGIADVLRDAIVAGRAAPVEASGVAWRPIRAKGDAAAGRRVLFDSVRKPQDGWVSRRLNRPVSLAISRSLVETWVTPNAVTLAVFVVRLAGLGLIAFGGRYLQPLIGFVLLQFASILDGCDGELARVRYQGSKLGAWLDTTLDHFSTLLLTGAVATNLIRHGGSIAFAIMAGITLVGGLVAIGAMFSYLVAIGSGSGFDVPGLAPPSAWKSTMAKIGSFIGSLTRLDAMYFTFLCCAAAGLLEVVQVLFAMGGVGLAIFYVRRRLQLRRAPRPTN
jgi:phosphatidylglycerophosphate synthase